MRAGLCLCAFIVVGFFQSCTDETLPLSPCYPVDGTFSPTDCRSDLRGAATNVCTERCLADTDTTLERSFGFMMASPAGVYPEAAAWDPTNLASTGIITQAAASECNEGLTGYLTTAFIDEPAQSPALGYDDVEGVGEYRLFFQTGTARGEALPDEPTRLRNVSLPGQGTASGVMEAALGAPMVTSNLKWVESSNSWAALVAQYGRSEPGDPEAGLLTLLQSDDASGETWSRLTIASGSDRYGVPSLAGPSIIEGNEYWSVGFDDVDAQGATPALTLVALGNAIVPAPVSLAPQSLRAEVQVFSDVVVDADDTLSAGVFSATTPQWDCGGAVRCDPPAGVFPEQSLYLRTAPLNGCDPGDLSSCLWPASQAELLDNLGEGERGLSTDRWDQGLARRQDAPAFKLISALGSEGEFVRRGIVVWTRNENIANATRTLRLLVIDLEGTPESNAEYGDVLSEIELAEGLNGELDRAWPQVAQLPGEEKDELVIAFWRDSGCSRSIEAVRLGWSSILGVGLADSNTRTIWSVESTDITTGESSCDTPRAQPAGPIGAPHSLIAKPCGLQIVSGLGIGFQPLDSSI